MDKILINKITIVLMFKLDNGMIMIQKFTKKFSSTSSNTVLLAMFCNCCDIIIKIK